MQEITDTNVAKAVLSTAIEHSVWESGIPSDEKKLLEDANFVYSQAQTAWDNNIRGKAVTAVKFSAQVDGAHVGKDIEPEDEYNPSNYKVKEVVDVIAKHEKAGDYDAIRHIRSVDTRKMVNRAADAALESEDDSVAEPDENGETGSVSPWREVDRVAPSKFDELFEAESFARAQAAKMNLPTPGRVDDIPNPTLERGVANLTIAELGERLNDASLCLAAATWQTAIAEIDEEHAKRVGNHYFNKEFPKAQKDAKNKDAATAIVEEIPQVKEWRDKQAEALARYTTYRSLKEIYQGTHNTISRIFAMKQEERERGY